MKHIFHLLKSVLGVFLQSMVDLYAHLPFLKHQEQFHFLVTYVLPQKSFLDKSAFENCHAGYQTVGTAVNNLNLYSVGTHFNFISYPDIVACYEFHLLHDNSGTLHNTNNPLVCEIFGFHSNVHKDSGFLGCGILCQLVSGFCCFEGIMCLPNNLSASTHCEFQQHRFTTGYFQILAWSPSHVTSHNSAACSPIFSVQTKLET
jgi:hypothetical protein